MVERESSLGDQFSNVKVFDVDVLAPFAFPNSVCDVDGSFVITVQPWCVNVVVHESEDTV